MAMKEPIMKEIANMKKLASFKVTELVEDIPEFSFDVSSVQLCSITKFNVSEGRIHRGAWLSNKTFIFSDGQKGRFCYGKLSKKEWKLIGIQEPLQNPYGILPDGDDLFVACVDSQSIDVFSVFDFTISRTIYLGFDTFGISRLKEYFYLAFGSKIVKIDNVGNKIKSFKTTGSSASNILTTKSGFIVYTDWKIDKVSAITDQWESVWEYTSPDLKSPYGLESDSQGNIYVTGMHSHNIHVLSNDGELIRIFGNLNNPVFVKIAKKNNVCCICSNYETLTFYAMK
ncbi:uncharacterized protein LOC134275535 [Saccostrea cucullata]|uniref:uncharacterized protein LOC134275535 n=1 Tax=Saccostrea cuccullata TaxID=36930 RepID=UPI002ED35A1C